MLWIAAVVVTLQRGGACFCMCMIVVSPVKGAAANEQATSGSIYTGPVCNSHT